ncbi:MAG TPA: hypothetical protein VGO52_21185, partial [Hyphomonadaceae bacterium]|nr:hypothetical protein [Hyphomonadaceae bacterium]
MKRLSASLAALAVATGAAIAQAPALTFDGYVEANRPKMAVRALTPDELKAAAKAVSAWNGKKSEANLAAVRPYAEAGEAKAMRAMMDGYVQLAKSSGGRGQS